MSLQEHLREIWHYDRPTMLFVTHDIDEALSSPIVLSFCSVVRGKSVARTASNSEPCFWRKASIAEAATGD